MHNTLTDVLAKLNESIDSLKSNISHDEPFGIQYGDWSFPCITRDELIEQVTSLVDLIEDNETDELGDSEPRINDYVRRLQHINDNTIPSFNGNENQAVPALQITLNGLRDSLTPVLVRDRDVENRKRQNAARRRIRAVEATLSDLENRTTALDEMLERIEHANTVAEELPIDLESLKEARNTIDELLRGTLRDHEKIGEVKDAVEQTSAELIERDNEAAKVLERCETAYSAATSVGLAAAFGDRSSSLSRSIFLWIIALVVALSAIVYLGSDQLKNLESIIQQPDISVSSLISNMLLSFFSVGAPIWFAWLSTKQIGQRFRLAEDYAYKASISRAYEGYRREAARIDKDMEAKLLLSALDHLDEIPLRLVEEKSYGSPWHEFISSRVLKQAVRKIPGFKDRVIESAAKESV